jgi:hypothetical protein
VVLLRGLEAVVAGRMVRTVRMVMALLVLLLDVDDELGLEVAVEGTLVATSLEVVPASDSIGIVLIRALHTLEHVHALAGAGGVLATSGREHIVLGGDDGSGIGAGEDGGGDESGRTHLDGASWKEMR